MSLQIHCKTLQWPVHQHVCSCDKFMTDGIRNLKVSINYFGVLLLKATYRNRPLNYYFFCLSFTKTYFSSHRSEKETSFLKQLNLVKTSITKKYILLVSIEVTDDSSTTVSKRYVSDNALSPKTLPGHTPIIALFPLSSLKCQKKLIML